MTNLLADATQFFGNIQAPPGVVEYGTENAQGIIRLLNNFLKIILFASGIYSLINLITSGIEYVGSSGNPDTIKKATKRIWMSVLGITIIAGSLALAALVGLIFFGDATAILNPKLPGVGVNP